MPGPGQSSVTRSLATTGTETRAGRCRYIYTIYTIYTIYIYMLLGTLISALLLCVLELYVLILIETPCYL